ncbi:unnamed protein product [Aphanomyces euteiches]
MTQVSAKLLVHEERIDKKTGRIAQLVEDINVHLPENIRVFTATKVHQSFRAREECIMREYEYFLPVSFIEQVCKPVSVDKAIESVLETLPRFEGIYDFHNFTKQRRYFYKRQAQKYRNRSRQEEDSQEIIDSRDEEDEENEVDDDEEDNLADISPNFAPHRVLVHPQELRQIHRFRDEVIIKEIIRSWGNSDNVAKWPVGFESWKESLSEMDIPTITNALDKYLINEEEKLAASAEVVKQARRNEDSLKLLPRAFSTAVCIRFDLTPGVYVTDVIAGLKYCILLGKLSVTATQEDLMEYMERTGLDELAKLGRRGY